MNKMKKSLCILLLIVSVFCAGMAVCAQETESDEGSYQEFESIGIKNEHSCCCNNMHME